MDDYTKRIFLKMFKTFFSTIIHFTTFLLCLEAKFELCPCFVCFVLFILGDREENKVYMAHICSLEGLVERDGGDEQRG